MSKNLNGKSYSQVMNEWAAQRSFLKRAGSTLMRPGHDVYGLARIWAWFWRFALLLIIPGLFYMAMLRRHGQSADFAALLSRETKRFLGADSADFKRTRWDMNGELRVELLKIKGSAESFFATADVENLSTSIPVPAVFRPAWHLNSVAAVRATMNLRSGAAGAKSALVTGEPAALTAGWGIRPDGTQLNIDQYRCSRLNLFWGTNSPASAGQLTESTVVLSRAEGGWLMTAAGGTFGQGWLSGLNLSGGQLTIANGSATISRADFTAAGGGTASLSGSITLGESPEVNARIKIEHLPMDLLLPEVFRPMVSAVCQGEVALTGSTNRSSGIVMDARLSLLSGSLRGIPILRALELATGETSLAQPELTGGRIHFTSQGSQEAGGQVIDADEVFLDCGTRMRIAMTLRHERKKVIATDIKAAIEASAGNVETVAVSTTGNLRIGLPAETAGRIKPEIRQEFLTREEQGYVWMDMPIRFDEGDFTKGIADRMVAMLYNNSGK